jgi:YVTN family beta-propeller protein
VRQAVLSSIRRPEAAPRRVLTTVLFTDIVGSTERAAALGDHGWKALLARHHAIVRHQLRRYHGRELDTAGDGFFAIFERPIQAIECATAISDELRPLDLQIRAGIHMGEAESMGGKLGGLTVHVASRALAQAAPGEILVTNTVREVTAGADVTFTDRGLHQFKGVPGRWRVYAVEWQRRDVPAAAPGERPLGPEAAARRLRWALGLTAGMVAVVSAALAVSWLLLSASPKPALVPLADSAMAIDPRTSELSAVVPAGENPTGIAATTETVWVLSLGDKVLYGIPVAGGSPRTHGLPGSPTGIAVGAGAVWITFGLGAAGESEGIVLRVSTGARFEDQPIPIGNGVSGIAFDEHGVWVVNELADSLTRIDPATRTVTMSVKVAQQPVAVTTGQGSVWVAHAVGRSIWRLDPSTMSKIKEVALSDPPTAIALGFGYLWVASAAGQSLAVIDTATNNLVETIALGQGARGVAAGPDAMWVAGDRDALLRIDPVSRTVSRSVALPGPAWGVAVLGSNVWVTVQR